MTRPDPRMESAMSTNQSKGRGWDFPAVPEPVSWTEIALVALVKASPALFLSAAVIGFICWIGF